MNLLDLKSLIKDRKIGSYYIQTSERELLERQLNEAKKEGLLYKNKITYTYVVCKNYIILILYTPHILNFRN